MKDLRDIVNRIRAEHGLREQASFEQTHLPLICMYSEHTVPRPPDYPEHVQYSGYWILAAPESSSHGTGNNDDDNNNDNDNDDLSQPIAGVPDELRTFLRDSSEPPIYMGFGSMPVRNPNQLLHDFATCIKRLGRRGIYCRAWVRNLDSEQVLSQVFGSDEQRTVICINGAPHEWLFPRCAMAIHHGGAGTTAASMRAGIPTCIMPVLADQVHLLQWLRSAGTVAD
jgi:sterol 3beta-glucosyltransferase